MHQARHLRVAVAAIALLGCGGEKKKDEPAPATGAPAAAPATDAASAAAAVTVDAGPRKPPPPPSPAYRKAMREGRKLEKAKDLAGARAAFERALAEVPEDARALSELSWVLVQQNRDQEAADTAERAVAATRNRKLRAASLYNLGRAREALDQKPLAILAYAESLALRPNKIVQKRLAQLGAPAEPMAARPLAGPFADLAAACKQVTAGDCDSVLTHAVEAGPPFDDVVLVRFGEPPAFNDDLLETACALALQTKAGWFVRDYMFDCEPDYDGGTSFGEIALVPQTRGSALLRIEHTATNAPHTSFETLTKLYVCGVGPSGKPSCTEGAVIYEAGAQYDPYAEDGPGEWDNYDVTHDYTLGRDGVLTIDDDKNALRFR